MTQVASAFDVQSNSLGDHSGQAHQHLSQTLSRLIASQPLGLLSGTQACVGSWGVLGAVGEYETFWLFGSHLDLFSDCQVGGAFVELSLFCVEAWPQVAQASPQTL